MTLMHTIANLQEELSELKASQGRKYSPPKAKPHNRSASVRSPPKSQVTRNKLPGGSTHMRLNLTPRTRQMLSPSPDLITEVPQTASAVGLPQIIPGRNVDLGLASEVRGRELPLPPPSQTYSIASGMF